MIGQFFSSRKHAGPPLPAASDPATDEAHTRQLLYPDSTTSLKPGAGAHDGPLPEIHLEYPRDCRIIIAQDETPAMPKTILFDSKPAPPRPASPALPSARGLHARRASLVADPTPPRSPTVGGFTRVRSRGTSISSMPNIDEHAQVQAKAQARAKESSDLANICLDCMFGNLAMNYRGNSNKIHIVPLDAKSPDAHVLSSSVDATASLGRAEGFRRRSNLAKSFTPANMPSDQVRPVPLESVSKEPKRRTVFITRMFSVTIPDDEDGDRTPNPPGSTTKPGGYPFPAASGKMNGARPTSSTHVRKSPMYAITIILHLPVSNTSSSGRPASRPGYARSSSHLSTSAPTNDLLSSSLESNRPSGSMFLDSSLNFETLLASSLSSDVDDRVDVVGQHWDVIMRALTSLQYVVQERILAHFKAPELVPPPPAPSHHRHKSSRSSLREAAVQTSRRTLRLQPQALMVDKQVQIAADHAGNRVVAGMRIPRVATGQGQWSTWREEARWLGRWAGRKEQNFFFFNLLTAFLGGHTEWLNVLGPKWARKRHREQQKASAGENITLPTRTIIASPDKMAARRLIYLLAAFLPPGTLPTSDYIAGLRPLTSTSLRACSQSPPTSMTPSRKHSLRRQIKRLPIEQRSMTNMMLQPTHLQSGVPTAANVPNEAGDSVNMALPNIPRSPGHSRRSSTQSVRSSFVIPSIHDKPSVSKSSVTAVPTVPSHNPIPTTNSTFSVVDSARQFEDRRPASSESLASVNLISSLQRSGTGQSSIVSNDSSNTSRWSGFINNFWNGGRASSTDQSDYLQSTDDGIGFHGKERSQSQLESMVQELSMDGVFDESDTLEGSKLDTHTHISDYATNYSSKGTSGVPPSAARPIPERQQSLNPQLKLSVNEKDGVIDVDIPLLPEFGSPLQSPLFGGFGSSSSQHGSSFGESSVLSMPNLDPEQAVNAAGWLSQFHPDFAIQGIRPYKDLESDIKRAMSTEPTPLSSVTTPSLESGPMERWVDVCSALIADTSTFSIKRIKFRRRVRLIPTPTYQLSAMTPGIPGMQPARSQYGNPYAFGPVMPMMSEVHLAEDFVEETIMDFDATLIDGVDRVLQQSGNTTRVNSAQSSRSSSRRGRHGVRETNAVPHTEPIQADPKGIIFDALESVVKNVTAEREGRDTVGDVADEGPAHKDHGTAVRTETDSSLKEGIRRWLVEVE